MHNIIKKIVCTTLLVFSVSGCSGSEEYKTHEIELNTDAYSISAESIQFEPYEENPINTDIESEIEGWINDFEARVLENKIATQELPNMQISQKVYTKNKNIISLVTQKYAYINGAHGNIWWVPRNYDIKNKTYITFNDLFYDLEYKKIVNQYLIQMSENNPDYQDLWEQPRVKDGVCDNFYITDKDIVLFFEPYELSYYAKGVVEFPIEKEMLRGYLKEEYLK